MNTQKIQKFILKLSNFDYTYLQSIMEFRDSVQHLIKEHDLTGEYICQVFDIPQEEYTNFTKGNYEYTLKDMAKLRAEFKKQEIEKINKL